MRSPPAGTAAVETARPIDHIDRRIGVDPRPATTAIKGTVAPA
jgi:hypothetical protein